MAETTEKEKREARPAGFTDGDYIPHNEAPNMPKVFSNADMVEPREPERKMMPVSMGIMLCLLTLCLGLWLGSSQSRDKGAAVQVGTDAVPGEETVSMLPQRSNGAGTVSVPGESSSCLGIAVQTVTEAAAGYYQLYYAGSAVVGAQIYALGEGSAAEQAGLRAGDILMALDGKAIRSAGELQTAESRYRAGEEAVCTIFRDGETMELPVVFQERQLRDGDDENGLDW